MTQLCPAVLRQSTQDNKIPCVSRVLLFRMKYIETELKKRKGIVENEEQKVKLKNAEDSLYELPENIRVSSAKKTEEMLSNQMLSGIPEVDLGIEYALHRSIGCDPNCQHQQLLMGRAGLAGSNSPGLALLFCISTVSSAPCSAQDRAPARLHLMTFGKKL